MLLSQVSPRFKVRRDELLRRAPGSVFIFAANPEVLRNDDVHYAYRQDSNFYYLSGFDEPESFLVLAPRANLPGYRAVLFCRRRNPEMEMWEGERYGHERAAGVFGLDDAFPIDELEAKLPELIKSGSRVFYRQGWNEATDRRVLSALETARRSYGRSGRGLPPIEDPTEIVGELRLIKDAEEIALMRQAGKASAIAHREAMKATRAGMTEREVQALIEFHFMKEGCARLGYGSIVAGGRNATCLHYRFNNAQLRDGDLLLIDAAGEFDYYTADITRTFPVGRKFTKEQAQIYDLVLKSQEECIALIKPGIRYTDIHQHACNVLIDGMLSLGLLKGSADEIFKSAAYKRFYPHGTGHWLGMDVHDRGLYQKDGQSRVVEEGMSFTVEPGFYVQPDDTGVPAGYRDIGIRIEDDIIVTRTGCEVLTGGVPKKRDEIEALRA